MLKPTIKFPVTVIYSPSARIAVPIKFTALICGAVVVDGVIATPANPANPSFIASQMGHASAPMVFSVYGEWIQTIMMNKWH